MAPSHPTQSAIRATLSHIYMLTGSIHVKSLWALRDIIDMNIRRLKKKGELTTIEQNELYNLEMELDKLNIFMGFYDAMRERKNETVV